MSLAAGGKQTLQGRRWEEKANQGDGEALAVLPAHLPLPESQALAQCVWLLLEMAEVLVDSEGGQLSLRGRNTGPW